MRFLCPACSYRDGEMAVNTKSDRTPAEMFTLYLLRIPNSNTWLAPGHEKPMSKFTV